MSYKANVYNVMIASPSDVAKERTKVVGGLLEVIRHNTAERKLRVSSIEMGRRFCRPYGMSATRDAESPAL